MMVKKEFYTCVRLWRNRGYSSNQIEIFGEERVFRGVVDEYIDIYTMFSQVISCVRSITNVFRPGFVSLFSVYLIHNA